MKTLPVQREIMIANHLTARGIRNPSVIRAMRDVPREEFVPSRLVEFAYQDSPLPIEEGQTISQPYMVAYMAEVLELGPGDRVLEIGTGTGYSAAVLSCMAAEVFTVEHFETLARKAAERLRRLGYANVKVLIGDGSLGWPAYGPYDAIEVTAGAPVVPEPLKRQLKIGGRLVIPVGEYPRVQTLVRVIRLSEGEFRFEKLCAVQFVPLIGAAGWSNG